MPTSKSIPVFSDNDRVGGELVLEPSCHQTGRLSVTIEGIFQYTSSGTEAVGDPTYTGKDCKDRHTFFTSTTVFSVSPPAESLRTPVALRETLSTHLRRRPSISSFELPRGQHPGQELPKTFSASALVGSGARGRAFVESTSISYKVTALWEPSDSYENRAQLEMPLLVLSNNHSNESSTAQPDFWLEMPLISSISVPFQCAVTLPSPANFSRSSAVPYYVVFTTTPRSSTLARDIAVNATISVTLVRYVSVNIPSRLPPSPPMTPLGSAEDSDSSSSHRMPLRQRKFFGRARSNTGPSLPSRIDESASRRSIHNNARIFAPPPPNPPFTETRNLITQLGEGFPKRPRRRKDQVHPAADRGTNGLPDGLLKGELKLEADMLPSINWAGISVKASSSFGCASLRIKALIESSHSTI
ncbi:hypothetical protein HWV62_4139 [Athelia sp. TMB]|nr:hypothetical protein HWV62_4139 [Athelia sp. TMB]